MNSRVILVAIALTVGVCPVAAQTPDDDPCLRDASCQRLLSRAQTASQAGQYEEALQTYRKAYSASQAPWILVNVGRMQHRLAYYQDAKKTYQRYLDSPRQAGDDEQREKAMEFLNQTEAELAKQQPAVAKSESSSAPPAAQKPLYKKWWLWTIVGGVVAGGVAGTIAGVYASRPTVSGVPANAQFSPF